MTENVQFGHAEDRPEISEGIRKWVEYAKQHKMHIVETTDRGDITPTVIIERDGEVMSIISAPDVDKIQGLNIAALSQIGFDPDFLTILLDSHIHYGKVKEGQTPEEAQEEFLKKYPPGSMQKACDEQGACETGEITDCLVCHRINRKGDVEMVVLPYAYHGKEGKPFQWIDPDKEQNIFSVKAGDENKVLEGLIPNTLRDIMTKGTNIQAIPELKKLAESLDISTERARFHTARAVMYILAGKNCTVKDYISPTHVEWIDYKPKSEKVMDQFVKSGMFPSEAVPYIQEILDKSLGTKGFQKELTELFADNAYWLPFEVRGKEANLAFLFESMCMSPDFPVLDKMMKDSVDSDSTPTQSAAGKRVRVWNGDQSEYLGEGNYVGNVKVYFVRMDDGSIRSLHNAEEEPEPYQIPNGGEIISSDDNPKIILDSGDTVYGCQVWWEPVEEDIQPKSHGYNKAK
jgi:hypothetical protein